MSNQQKTKNKKNPEELEWKGMIGATCAVGVYIFLFLFLVVYAFYFKDGYTQIATVKFEFLKKVSIYFAYFMIPLAVLHGVLPTKYGKQAGKGLPERIYEARNSFSATDLFVFSYALVFFISYLVTEYQDEAAWGTSGWFMGLGTQLICVGIYFFVSRYYDGKIDLMPYIMAVTFILFFWGLLNRFSVYPVAMKFSAPAFISSMGNINWFCGYWTVFYAIGIIYYMLEETMIKRVAYGIYVAVALGLGIVEGSDSAFVSLVIVFLVLFWLSFSKRSLMKRFLEIGIIFSLSCQVMRLISLVWPYSLNKEETLVKLFLGNLTLITLIVLAGIRVLLAVGQKKSSIQDASLKKWFWIWILMIGILAAGLVIYLVLLYMNTTHRGSIGALSASQNFYLDQSWANGRGGSWRDGFAIFFSLPFWQKWVGVGPDCFAVYGYSHDAIRNLLIGQFANSRLTNAHNECITLLADVGILGLGSFLGLVWSSIARCMKRGLRDPYFYIFALCLLSYFWNNMFSFQQIENLPFFFFMLGLAEWNLRSRTEHA